MSSTAEAHPAGLGQNCCMACLYSACQRARFRRSHLEQEIKLATGQLPTCPAALPGWPSCEGLVPKSVKLAEQPAGIHGTKQRPLHCRYWKRPNRSFLGLTLCRCHQTGHQVPAPNLGHRQSRAPAIPAQHSLPHTCKYSEVTVERPGMNHSRASFLRKRQRRAMTTKKQPQPQGSSASAKAA